MCCEEQWMLRCRSGDKDAFYKLVEPYLDRVYSTSTAILRSTHLAEDAVQNAMIEAYQAIMNGKEIRNFGSWFKKVAAMRAMDLARKRSRLSKRTTDFGEWEPVDHQRQPVDTMLENEEKSLLFAQVMSLPIRYRSVILLYYYQEMSLDEISEVLGVKKGTVKSRLHTARSKLLKLQQSNHSKRVIFHV
jgi:RNA polymerase sigma-70 factor (ECF subfamily)